MFRSLAALASLVILPVSIVALCGTAGGAYDPAYDVMSVTAEFKTTGFKFASRHPFTPIASFGGSTYLVWVDGSLHPMVAKITGGAVTTARIDPNDAYTVMDDGHHQFSLGVDRDGYIHVTGDMHNHPAFINPGLPEEYRSSAVMYWVSDNPEDITGFTFLGNDSARAIPGYAYTYGSFHTDMNADLYYLSRIAVQKPLIYQTGDMGVGMYRYDAASRSWHALGSLPPSAAPPEMPCVLWEDNGVDGGVYQGFMASMRFDHRNRLHFAATINADNSSGMTHVVYGCSDDFGETFRHADGTPIAPLPLRVEAGPSQADVIEGPLHYVDSFAGVFFDKHCTPAVNYVRIIDGEWLTGNYRFWNDSLAAWSEMMTTPARGNNRTKNHVDGNGILDFTNYASPGAVCRATALGNLGTRFPTWYDLYAFDEPGLRATNILRAVALRTEQTKLTMSVLRIEFANSLAGPPQIVLRADSTVLAKGALVDYGETDLNSPVVKVFTVENAGDTQLTLGGITAPDGFTVTQAPPASVMPGTAVDFEVRLDAAAEGYYAGDLVVENNDGEDNPFILVLVGAVGPGSGAEPAARSGQSIRVSSNPVRDPVEISFTISEASRTSIDVFDLLGRRLQCLESADLAAGSHTIAWDRTGPTGPPLASGIYFIRLVSGGRTSVVKVAVLR